LFARWIPDAPKSTQIFNLGETRCCIIRSWPRYILGGCGLMDTLKTALKRMIWWLKPDFQPLGGSGGLKTGCFWPFLRY
jgi:hypothetical protein